MVMATLLAAAVATLVFCAPGNPGSAGDAQPFVDQFVKVTSASAGWKAGSLAAIYDPTEEGGLQKLGKADAVLAFVPYAFYVQYARQLHLTALAQGDVAGIGTRERWTLVGKGDAPTDARSMTGYSLVSTAGYAPEFIRHSALEAWPLPADLKIESTGQVLSALRHAAAGEHVVVLLDQTQAAATPTLPFAAQLKTLVQSPPLPVAVIAVVDSRLAGPRAKAMQRALLKLPSAADGADALAALHLKGFVMPELPGHAEK